MIHLNELASKFTVHPDVFMTKFLISENFLFVIYVYGILPNINSSMVLHTHTHTHTHARLQENQAHCGPN